MPRHPIVRRRFAGLTANEAEVLGALFRHRDKRATPYARGFPEPGWCRPRDVGGTQGSHHAHTLARLARRQHARQRPYLDGRGGLRQSWMYRISDAGIAAWALFEHAMRRKSVGRKQEAPRQ